MENKSLYLIVNEAMALEQQLMESGGEITPEIESALAVNQESLMEKADGYQHVIERFESLSEHYAARAEFFATIGKQCKTAAERLKNNIKFAMIEMGVDELRGQDIRFKVTPTSGTLHIDDEEMIPVEFKTEIVKTEVDKKSLKEALKSSEIPGARLEPGFSIRTYANTPEKKSKKAVVNV